jgi:hypothetical protein
MTPPKNHDATDLHLPNAKNCIQSALYQLERGNNALAVEFLQGAKRSIDKASTPSSAPKLSIGVLPSADLRNH